MNSFILIAALLLSFSSKSTSVEQGLCACQVLPCEVTENVQGCDGQLTYGQDGSGPAFCDAGSNGAQNIWSGYAGYVINSSPSIDCSGYSGQNLYYQCTCQGYNGPSTGINLTTTNYQTNAQGYVTDLNYYDNNVGTTHPCYCDVAITEDGSTVSSFFSLGSAQQPVYCEDTRLFSIAGDTGLQSTHELLQCGDYVGNEFNYYCRCQASDATPTGNYPNLTTAQVAPSPVASRVNLIQSQIANLNGGKGSGSGSGSSSNSNSNSNSNTNTNADTGGNTNTAIRNLPVVMIMVTALAILVHAFL